MHTSPSTAARATTPHPINKVARHLRGMGVVYIILSATAAWLYEMPSLLVGSLLGGFCLFAASRAALLGVSVRQLHSALDRIGRGRLDEATALLDSIAPNARHGSVGTGMEYQRSIIALRRDDLDGAIAHATRAMAVRLTLAGVHRQQMQRASARGLRAVAFAASGDSAKALADAQAVRVSPSAGTEALASAAVAEAVVHARSDDREKLASLLARDRKLLLEHTTPRDRALVRTLQRMLAARSTSVYREPAKRDDEAGEEPALATWIARLVPAAAAFVPVHDARNATTLPVGLDGVVTADAVDAVRAARLRGRKKGFGGARRIFLLWGLLVVMFLAIWQFLNPPEGAHGTRPNVKAVEHVEPVDSESNFGSRVALMLPGAALVVIALGYGFLVNRRTTHRALAASRLLAEADSTRAEAAFLALSKNRAPLTAASADLMLARIAEERTDWESARVHAERGIGRVARGTAVVAAAHDHLLPALVTERAFALAALGRHDEASAELATLQAENSTFSHLASAQLRVRLMQAVRRNELAKARELAKTRTPDLPLSARDELLADVLTVTSGELIAEGEIERIRAELRADASLRAWLSNVYPAGEPSLAMPRGAV